MRKTPWTYQDKKENKTGVEWTHKKGYWFGNVGEVVPAAIVSLSKIFSQLTEEK